MKRIVTLLLLMQSIALISSAQSYTPVLREENSWNVMWGQCDVAHVDSIFTINDSIVESKIYATLYKSEVSNKIGYLEEDTIEGKLTYHDISGKSYLVFDISLVPEDTIRFIGYFDDEVELVVADTATIDGLKHIEFEEHIQMCSVHSKFVMIESVGPNVGIPNVSMYNNPIFENYLLCNYKSDEFYYGNDLFNNECNINWTGIKSNRLSEQVQIEISGDELLITNYLKQGKLSIYSMQGSLLLDRSINFGSNSILLQDLRPGAYIYLIEIDNDVISDKFIRY